MKTKFYITLLVLLTFSITLPVICLAQEYINIDSDSDIVKDIPMDQEIQTEQYWNIDNKIKTEGQNYNNLSTPVITTGEEDTSADKVRFSKFPVLKCNEYPNRPKGESGDSFCENEKKACVAVYLSGAENYSSSCASKQIFKHITRCCWIE